MFVLENPFKNLMTFPQRAHSILYSFQIKKKQKQVVILTEVPVFSMTDMTPSCAPTDS